MAYRRVPFALDEWFHCYSRGIEKDRLVFETPGDFRRLTQLLYLANDTQPVERGRFEHVPHEKIFGLPRTHPLVSVGAYCLMGTHPHFLLQEKTEGGITKFMRKIGTGYTMYFNLTRKRIGNLLIKPFRSKHVASDEYLQRVVQYIHLNPAEIYEPQWKKGVVQNITLLEQKIRSYAYSSLPDYLGIARPERTILNSETMEAIGANLPPFPEILAEAKEYYAELAAGFGKNATLA